MNLENLEFLVYEVTCCQNGRHDIWVPARHVWHTFYDNFPEVNEQMVIDALESLTKKGLIEKDDSEGAIYLRSRVWKALGIPMRDRYGNVGEEDED